jgi:hypothetical protein
MVRPLLLGYLQHWLLPDCLTQLFAIVWQGPLSEYISCLVRRE